MVSNGGETAVMEALMGRADVYWNTPCELENWQLECAHYLNDMAANWDQGAISDPNWRRRTTRLGF